MSPQQPTSALLWPGRWAGEQLWEEMVWDRMGPLPRGAQLVGEARGADVIIQHPEEPGKVGQPLVSFTKASRSESAGVRRDFM